MSARGFTTLEIIVVVAVIGVLAGILTPIVMQQLEKSKMQSCNVELDVLRTAILRYAREYGFRPATPGAPTAAETARGTFPRMASADGLYNAILDNDMFDPTSGVTPWNPVTREGWNGPYVDPGEVISVDADGDGVIENDYAFKIDPWNRYYYYANTLVGTPGNQTRAVFIGSGGPDQTLNTADDILLLIYSGNLF